MRHGPDLDVHQDPDSFAHCQKAIRMYYNSKLSKCYSAADENVPTQILVTRQLSIATPINQMGLCLCILVDLL